MSVATTELVIIGHQHEEEVSFDSTINGTF